MPPPLLLPLPVFLHPRVRGHVHVLTVHAPMAVCHQFLVDFENYRVRSFVQTYRRINFRSDEPARTPARAEFRPEVRAGTLKNIPVPIKYFPAARVIRAEGTLRSLDDSIEETSRRDLSGYVFPPRRGGCD